MAAELASDSIRACVTCGSPVTARYCAVCGEKVLTRHDHSVWHLVTESLELFVHFDSKFLRTVRPLLTRPGFLTQEYWIGRRTPYMKPLQLLIVINLLYFAAAYASGALGFHARVMFPTLGDILNNRVFSGWARAIVQGRLRAQGAAADAYGAAFDAELEHLAKSLVIVLVPILAAFLRLFYRRTRTFLDQLIAATHLVSFYILFWSIFMIVAALAIRAIAMISPAAPARFVPVAVTYIPLVAIGSYVFMTLKALYHEGALWTVAKTAVFLFVVIQAITNLYDWVLFCIALALV